MPKVVRKSEHQKIAEAEVESFQEDLGPFVVAADTTRMPMVFTDAEATDNPIIFANDSFLTLTGYPREEVLGQNFNFLLANGADGETTTRVVAEFAGKAGEHLDMLCRRKDGTEFWAGLLFNPVRDEGGKVIQHFVSLVDLTRHKNELADALKARDVPYFFSTGSSVTSIKDGYRDHDVLKKPFTFDQLSNMLSRSLLHQTNVVKLRH